MTSFKKFLINSLFYDPYPQKWIEVWQNPNRRQWAITAQGDDILIRVPDNHNIKELLLVDVSQGITL